MAWITITDADVQTRLAGAELSAYRSAAKATGQADPLPEIISGVVDEVRGYVAACDRNTLGAGSTIPEKLKSAALAMIRYRLITRLPLSIGDERKAEYNDALRLLERVSECKFSVEEPEVIDPEAKSSGLEPSVGSRSRNFTSETQDGV